MCYFSGKLYTTEGRHRAGSAINLLLSVYSVTGLYTITLLDTLDLGPDPQIIINHPRVDLHTGKIYIPCWRRGVCVVRYDGNKLAPVTTLMCVKDAASLAVVSTDTLYVCDFNSETVCVVDVNQDRVTHRLQKLWTPSRSIAVLGDTVLAGMRDALCIYRHGISTPEQLHNLKVLRDVTAVTTDHHSSFLVVDCIMDKVYVLGVSGNHTHTIPIPQYRSAVDCTVVGEQLWVGCQKGYIIVMSSQKHRCHHKNTVIPCPSNDFLIDCPSLG